MTGEDRDLVAAEGADPEFMADLEAGGAAAERKTALVLDYRLVRQALGVDLEHGEGVGADLALAGKAAEDVLSGIGLPRGIKDAIGSPAQIVGMKAGLDDVPARVLRVE